MFSFSCVVSQVSWSPDSTQLLSASGDKTAKIWDVANNSVVTTFNMGSDVLDQQLGCLWQKDHLLTVSLSGYINYLDKNNPNRPLRTIKVTYKNIQLNVYIELVLCKCKILLELGSDGFFMQKSVEKLVKLSTSWQINKRQVTEFLGACLHFYEPNFGYKIVFFFIKLLIHISKGALNNKEQNNNPTFHLSLGNFNELHFWPLSMCLLLAWVEM